LATCLRDHDHSHHSSGNHYSLSHASLSSDASQESAGPVIHCPFAENQIGSMAQSGLKKLGRTQRVTSVQAPFLYIPGSITLRGNLWLEAVFRGIVTFPYPDKLGRRFFLSVLRI
jgi:hypothetical protein